MEDTPRGFRTFRKFAQQEDPAREAPSADSAGLNPRFAGYAWIVLLYNLAAVAWGVFVRASMSGDGCGSHWPLCDGDHTPLMGNSARFVEMSHRISTGIIGPMVIAMVIWAFRAFPKGHLARPASVLALVMTLLEGGIGAALVRFGLVTDNDSAARAGVMAFHVISTFFLVGAIAAAAIAAGQNPRPSLKGQGSVASILAVGLFGMLFMGVSGAISALGHQLHETPDVLKAALNPATHWMVRLQPLHPLIAASVGLFLLLTAGLIVHLRPDPRVARAVRWMVGLYVVQLLFGALNIWFKAPIPMQMGHLVLADLNWISVVVVGLFAFAEGVERVEHRPAPAEAIGDTLPPLRGRALVNAYIALTKPRVISLLLFTTLTAAIAARGEWPGGWLMPALFVGGYMSAGAANAINMVIDRDIDLSMKRTATRPTVTQSISSPNALRFAFALALIAFGLLWSVANLLSAVLALAGLVFYVVVYTMLLKRSTWTNIVIGGAAGAFPPLVGWAAVTNDLPPLALYLFAIIFVWTPVHFWALALLLKDDYAAAGVPMLPCVKGDRQTVKQIALYGAGTFLASLLPLMVPQVGWIYATAAVGLSAWLFWMCVQLYRDITRPKASRLFHFSMLYLALLFLMFAIDRTVVMQVAG
jgi:protoheme IX farnesyltransferase